MWSSLLKAGREALVLSEKLKMTNELAQKAFDMALADRERIVRLETIVDLAVKAEARRLPPPQ
ncbi:hypothetical protein BH10PSE13_BH10PSE13_06450 [soil metagenome]